MKAKLVLENGVVFTGESFGANEEVSGEVVFNTSITGYQEILSDPSYTGQIVTMTYPLIGNYGVTLEDIESAKPQASGIIVREYFDFHSNWRAKSSLGEWLKKHYIVAIHGIDTRKLTKILRSEGALRGTISTTDLNDANLIKKSLSLPKIEGTDLVKKVTCKKEYQWGVVTLSQSLDNTQYTLSTKYQAKRKLNVVVFDFGVKYTILRRLAAYGCSITVVPALCSAEHILEMKPDGILLSNGPGDPDAVQYAIANIKKLIGKKPIFGICLGHQLLALALGGKTYKLKFGHHGGNHPVKNLLTNTIEITAQNHGFAVDWDSMDTSKIELTHLNLNDNTVEGFRHTQYPLFAVQYHPEAGPGPHDSDYLFAEFVKAMR
mgnify:FL=1